MAKLTGGRGTSTPRDSGSKASSIAGKAMNGAKLTKAQTLTLAASVLSQNQYK